MKTTVSLNRLLALGAFLGVLSASAVEATTPRGSIGDNSGSEVAPINLSPRVLVPASTNLTRDRGGNLVLVPPAQESFNQQIAALVRDLRSGNLQIRQGQLSSESQLAIADSFQSRESFYRYMEVIGELRTIISEPAVPPGEAGVEAERPGFVRIDLKRAGSMPSSIAERFSKYVDYLNTRAGEYTVFGSDRVGVTRNIRVVLVPKLNRTVEVRFTSDLRASANPDGKPATQVFIAPNAKVAAVLAGVMTALDAASASATTLKTASAMVLSLGNISLSSLEIQQLSQALVESLLANEGMLAGCGKDVTGLTCTDLNIEALATAIRAYNQVVNRTSDRALIALANNSEFQGLGESLRRARIAIEGR